MIPPMINGFLFGLLNISAPAIPNAYAVALFVVQMLRVRMSNAQKMIPIEIISSIRSPVPNTRPPSIPEKIIMPLPTKKPRRPAMNAVLAVLANLAQLPACVPPDANVPTITVIAEDTVISPVGVIALKASMLPTSLSARMITRTMRIAIAGIATYETYDIIFTP